MHCLEQSGSRFYRGCAHFFHFLMWSNFVTCLPQTSSSTKAPEKVNDRSSPHTACSAIPSLPIYIPMNLPIQPRQCRFERLKKNSLSMTIQANGGSLRVITVNDSLAADVQANRMQIELKGRIKPVWPPQTTAITDPFAEPLDIHDLG